MLHYGTKHIEKKTCIHCELVKGFKLLLPITFLRTIEHDLKVL